MASTAPKTVIATRHDAKHITFTYTVGELLDRTIPGMALERAARDIDEGKSVDPRTEELAGIRQAMQRDFEQAKAVKKSVAGESVTTIAYESTAKKRNAEGSLKIYLQTRWALSPEETFAVLPAFVAVLPEQLKETPIDTEVAGLRDVWFNYDIGSVGRWALADGECRDFAMRAINSDNSVSPAVKDKLLNKTVTIELYHGISRDDAAVLFVDLNCKAIGVSMQEEAAIDPRNEWIVAAKDIFGDLDIKLASTGRQLTQSHLAQDQRLLVTHAEQMVKAIVLGANQALVKSKKTPESFKELGVDGEKLRRAGVEWFGEMFKFFGEFYGDGNGAEVLTDQSRVIRTVAVRAALASLGGAFYRSDLEGKAEARETLRKINWIIDERWQGIGGKVSQGKDGVWRMAAGSGKEFIAKAVSAINPRVKTTPAKQSKAWRAVRGIPDQPGVSEDLGESDLESASMTQ